MDIGRGHDNLPADSSIKVMSKAPLVFLVLASPFGLGSCGGVGQGTGAAKPLPGFSLTGLPSAAVAIVKVGEGELKELPLGHEQALAYESQRKSGLLALGGGGNFEQPKLPESGSEMDGSLLPPKSP